MDCGMPCGGGMLHALDSSDSDVAGRRRRRTHHGRDGFHEYHDGGPRKWSAETRILRAGTAALRSSSVCGIDWTGGRGGNRLARGNDSPRAALDPGKSNGSPAGRSNGCASEELCILLCVAGSVRTGSVSKGNQSHVVCSQGARVRTPRPDCGLRAGNASECCGVRAVVDEASGGAQGISRAVWRRRGGGDAI